MEIFKPQRSLFELENLEKKLLSNVAPAEGESRAHLVELGHQEVEEHGDTDTIGVDIPVFGDDGEYSSSDQKDKNSGNQIIKLLFL